MSAGEPPSLVRRIRQQRVLVILRDDHIGDPIGAIFLDPSAANEDSIMARLTEYLGARVRIVRAEIAADRAEVRVEIQAFVEEANRLAAVAADLRDKGARRNATALFQQVLELDPLNSRAATGLGMLLADREDYGAALTMLRRARETGGDTADLLHALGRACLKLERTASAIVYLESAFALDPANFGVRRTLNELGRKPKAPSRARMGQDPERVRRKP
ncbi:MAG: tetratricopeptide repeat protein [Candidatus Binataceae bacterium]